MNPAIPIVTNDETAKPEVAHRTKARLIKDPEIMFMSLAAKHLDNLSPSAQSRVTDWLAARARERLNESNESPVFNHTSEEF